MPKYLTWRWRRKLVAVVIVLFLAGAVAWVLWSKLFRQLPKEYESDERYFKYGSIGTEEENGLPYWVWLVLPKMFPDYIGAQGGYSAFGFLWEDGEEVPIGFSKRTIGFPRVGINCALCHTARVRAHRSAPPQFYVGGPAHQAHIQGYLNFLSRCASDPRFTAEAILEQINYHVHLSWLEKLLYRHIIIPKTKEGLLKQKDAYAWTQDEVHRNAPWGRGRIDPFNPVKFGMLGLHVDPTIGNSDMVPLWNLRARDGRPMHWDGLNDSLREVIVSSALGDGATPKTLPHDFLVRLERWLSVLPAPANPFVPPKAQWPVEKAALWEKGKAIFFDAKKGNCADCHTLEGARGGAIIPIEEIGTDRHRLDMWTTEAADTYNRYPMGQGATFRRFRKTHGYVAVPLEGLWLRAPYLHNGSVPTLKDLLEPAHKRPSTFYRGYDVFDPETVGFIHTGQEAANAGSFFDTATPGNSNCGHEYGTALTPDEKRSLLEYLKSL